MEVSRSLLSIFRGITETRVTLTIARAPAIAPRFSSRGEIKKQMSLRFIKRTFVLSPRGKARVGKLAVARLVCAPRLILGETPQ